MPYIIDEEINLPSLNCFYTILSHHRNVQPAEKSKWTISLDDEINTFCKAYSNDWKYGYACWGLYFDDNNIILQLGINSFKEQLFISKFVDGSKNKKWHGYPADYKRNLQDRPPVEVLSLWKNTGKIKKHHISKIRSGKKCNL